jgi:hypothetical protein
MQEHGETRLPLEYIHLNINLVRRLGRVRARVCADATFARARLHS